MILDMILDKWYLDLETRIVCDDDQGDLLYLDLELE